LQLTGKISLEFDFSSSSLLQYGPMTYTGHRTTSGSNEEED